MNRLPLIFALALLGCRETPPPVIRPLATPPPPPALSPTLTPDEVIAPKLILKTTPAPTPTPAPVFVISSPGDPKPVLTSQGLTLIVYYEVGGEQDYRRNPYPEYSGEGSGVTWGIGYDAHQNKQPVIFSDWQRLGTIPAHRLAATQPYFGSTARVHVHDVKDIKVPWEDAIDVFVDTDVTRTDAQCRRAFPGFDELRHTAMDAIRSLVFNRGASMAGPNRSEMRDMRDYGVPRKDYERLAKDERDMKRVWRGTSIQAGMNARREAEAKLFETP